MKAKQKTISFAYAFAVTAIVAVLSFASALAAVSSASGSLQTELDSTLEYAGAEVDDFVNWESKTKTEFMDDMYSTANAAAALCAADSSSQGLQNAVRYLGLDSVAVFDAEGKCTASYPEDYTGQTAKKLDDYSIFNKIVKGMSVKLMNTPVLAEGSDDEYSLLAGVPQSDSTGAVVVGITTSDYGDVTGASLADKCGENVIVAKDGETVSSTFADGASLETLGISRDNLSGSSFTLSRDGESYLCKAASSGEYTVICAVRQGGGSTAIWIMAIADAVLLLCAGIAFALSTKLSGFFAKFFDIKFWKFIMVGVLNTVVGTGLQFVFFNLFGWNEWISSLVGYILGSILSYFLNKYFTFKNAEKGIKPILRFALNIAVCYGLAYGIAIPLIKTLCLSNEWTMFGWTVETFAGNFSMIVGACLFVAFNYIGQRFFAFREKNENDEKK